MQSGIRWAEAGRYLRESSTMHSSSASSRTGRTMRLFVNEFEFRRLPQGFDNSRHRLGAEALRRQARRSRDPSSHRCRRNEDEETMDSSAAHHASFPPRSQSPADRSNIAQDLICTQKNSELSAARGERLPPLRCQGPGWSIPSESRSPKT